MKKSLLDMSGWFLGGIGLGILGLILGAGESRTGRYSGVEPEGCWLIAFGLGIYTFWRMWMRAQEAGLILGLTRIVVMLLPLAAMSTLATGMVDRTIDYGPDTSLPLQKQALFASIVYVFWVVGIVVSVIMFYVISITGIIWRLLFRRAPA